MAARTLSGLWASYYHVVAVPAVALLFGCGVAALRLLTTRPVAADPETAVEDPGRRRWLAAVGLLGLGDNVRAPALVRYAAAPGCVGVLLLFASWINWRTYFVEFPSGPIDDTSELARRVDELPADTQGWLLGAEHPLHSCPLSGVKQPRG